MEIGETLRSIAFPLARTAAYCANALLFGLAPVVLLVLRPVLAAPDTEALLRLAPSGTENMGELLVSEVARGAAGKLDDDLTMLVVEFEGAPVVGEPEGQSGEERWHSRR